MIFAELRNDRGCPMSMTSMMDIAFDIDVHMCDEISLFIIDDVPTYSDGKLPI